MVDPNTYMDGPVRYGVIATAFWGVVGFLVGVVIAFQLAFPYLNFEWAQGFLNFGRLRPPAHLCGDFLRSGGNAADRNGVLCRAAYIGSAAVGR